MNVFQRLVRRRAVDREIDRELQFHIDRQIADHIATGLSPEEARRRTRLEFGGIQQIKEEIRETTMWTPVENLAADVRYSARALKRSPGFAAAAMLALAFGSGGTTAIASVLNDLIVRPPRIFRNPSELVVAGEVSPTEPSSPSEVTAAVFDRWQSASTLRRVAAIRSLSLFVRIDREVESAGGQAVSPDLLDMLGAAPALGRSFSPGDDRLEAPPVALLSYDYWQRRFAGDVNVVGRRIEITGRAHEIIGVMPRGYALGWSRDGLVVPLSPDRIGKRDVAELIVVGRLAPGASIERARAELLALQRTAAEELPARGDGWTVRVDQLRGRSGLSGRGMALVFPLLFAATLLTLLATAANLAILMVARGMARMREAAVRAALGASRYRLMQQTLLEALLLAAGGGAFGLIVAIGLSRLMIAIAPGPVAPDFAVTLDLQTFAVAALIVGVAGLASGAAPALSAARTDVVDTLKGAIVPGPRPRRLHGALVVLEIAVAMVMLVCVGLFVSAYGRVLDYDPGFEWSHLITVRIDAGFIGSDTARAVNRGVESELAGRLRSISGVTHATIASIIPPSRGGESRAFVIRGGEARLERASARIADVDTNFFDTIGLKTLRGRAFNASDSAMSEQAVISDAVARRYWPSSDPIGAFIQIEGETRTRQIVAVVADVQFNASFNRGPVSYVFRPRSGFVADASGPSWSNQSYAVVRTASDPATFAQQIRQIVRETFPDRPMPAPVTIGQMLQQGANEMLLAASLIVPMVLLTLALSAGGIYGLIAQQALLRTRELGIRAALGADRRQLVGLVLRDGLRLAQAGVAAGLVGVVAINRLVMSVYAGVTWARPSVVALCALLMAGVALAASYRPASRAGRIDPMTALRYE